MKKVVITITVNKRKWLKAVANGWCERFNEELAISSIPGIGVVSANEDVPLKEDLLYAVHCLDLSADEVEMIEV